MQTSFFSVNKLGVDGKESLLALTEGHENHYMGTNILERKNQDANGKTKSATYILVNRPQEWIKICAALGQMEYMFWGKITDAEMSDLVQSETMMTCWVFIAGYLPSPTIGAKTFSNKCTISVGRVEDDILKMKQNVLTDQQWTQLSKQKKFGTSALMAFIPLTTPLGVTGTQSTCNAGTVNEGDPAIVTCHFDKDVGEQKRDVIVSRLIPGKEPEALIRYTWYGNETEPDIMTSYGATVVGNISNTLTFKIAQAKRETDAGIYNCLVANSDWNKTTSCTLNISENVYEGKNYIYFILLLLVSLMLWGAVVFKTFKICKRHHPDRNMDLDQREGVNEAFV